MVQAAPELPADFTNTPIICVMVGPKRKKFLIHEGILRTHSSFFDACLKSTLFKEGQEKEVYLKEDDPDAFNNIVVWLYRGELGSFLDSKIRETWTRTYIPADKLGIKALKNPIVDAMRRSTTESGNLESMILLSKRGLAESQLGKFLIKYIGRLYTISRTPYVSNGVTTGRLREVFEEGGDLAVEILNEIGRNIPQKKGNPVYLTGCVFHDHAAGEVCHGSVKSEP